MRPGCEGTMKRIVIIGASITGHTIATQIRERDCNVSITLVTDEPYPVYDRRRLFDFFSGSVKETELFFAADEAYLRQSITLMKGKKVSAINTQRKVIYFKEKGTLGYDLLVIASGSRPVIPDIPGNKKPGVFTLYGLDDVKSLSNMVIAESVCIVGANEPALRLAPIAAHKYKTGVKIISSAPVNQLPVCEGCDSIVGEVTEIIGEGRVQAVKLGNGKAIGVSAVIFMGQERCAADFLQNSPFTVMSGYCMVDNFFRTNIEGVFAAGSAARHKDGNAVSKTWDECVFEAGLVVDALMDHSALRESRNEQPRIL